MRILINNTRIYKHAKLLRPAIGGILRGNVKPFIGYLKHLYYENELKNTDFEALSFVLYYCGYDIERKVLYTLSMNKPVVVEFKDKTKFFLKHLLDYFHAGLYYEPKTFNFIMKYLKSSKVFIDVGANIGGYSIRAAKHCKVYAFEPLPRNFNLLKLNEEINNVKINAFNVAASNKKGKIKLYYINGGWGTPSIKRIQRESIEVEMRPIDDIVNEKEIDLIKIDVEGAEDIVLEGAKNCLKRTHVVIIEKSESFINAYKILKSLGFKYKQDLDHNVLFIK
jgi:FkbM family methyltransferase